MLDPTVDPFTAFDAWYAEAKRTEPDVPDAMQLATCMDGRPSVRTVLLKAHGPDGFQFFTNLGSRKAVELAANPYAAAVFHWKSSQRQVRIEGPVVPEPAAVSDAYFATRDRGSQIGAWASHQSRPIPPGHLEAEVARLTREFEGRPVPRPDGWGGYRIHPESVELWQGRPSRLHERLQYDRVDGGWTTSWLAP